ncbi:MULTISPECIES: MalY/PatB family protein [unclassified Fibrobacter]|uniref:MalY/PatB family protein n=1 Tax=unclassified Fibrobacter TaxID=2634177 RepID=UPI000D6B8207|nr:MULTISPECIES: MalY/PatB family protein [unclassified Fibrobacter]PWJ56889.1 cystathionine beta-lyase [Fibrobacter sp. UWR4]PZW62722.1 cystathionine beta-lyase [Fibrobacter sp. UWR1]
MTKERNLNFDEIVDRRGTNCLKYDFAVERGALKPGEDSNGLLPLWIADMDFRTSSFVQDALIRSVEHGIFGYTEPKAEYFKALQNFYRRRHNFEFDPRWVIKTPGVMIVLALAIKAFTKVGDAVLIQQPVYMHFPDVILQNDRKLVSNDLVYGEDGRYHIGFEDFERKIVENNVKLFLLCSPHNPVCRVWTRGELLRVGEICLKHNVFVVADEIHNDFVFEGTHTVFASLGEKFADNSITVTSPTKTFNLAGLQIAHAFIKNPEVRKAIRKEIDGIGYSQVTIPGLVAAQAAYEHGEEWLESLKKYLKGNIDFVDKFVKENLPGVKLVPMEATYLAWLDFKGTGLSTTQVDDLIRNKARLWLNSGTLFGKTGECFQRVNLACPRSILEEALNRIKKALEAL